FVACVQPIRLEWMSCEIDSVSPPSGPGVGAPRSIQSDHSQVHGLGVGAVDDDVGKVTVVLGVVGVTVVVGVVVDVVVVVVGVVVDVAGVGVVVVDVVVVVGTVTVVLGVVGVPVVVGVVVDVVVICCRCC